MRRAHLLLLLFACTEERHVQGPVTRSPFCDAPICPDCACDLTTTCDSDCNACDPECGQCRVEGQSCRARADGGVVVDSGPQSKDAETSSDATPPPPPGVVTLFAHRGQLLGRGTNQTVRIDLTLSNGLTESISLASPLFSVRATSGLEFPGDPSDTGRAANGCPAVATLAPGREVSCAVVFPVPEGQIVEAVGYRRPDGELVTAQVSQVNPCSDCDGACVDLQTDPQHCGQCRRQVEGTCVDGQPQCSGALQPCLLDPPFFEEQRIGCVDVTSDREHCGACGERLTAGMSCVGGQPRCDDPSWTACPTPDGLRCVSTTWDNEHCGACGRTCVDDCTASRCGSHQSSTTPTSCNSICNNRPCLLSESYAEYAGVACDSGIIQLPNPPSCTTVPPSSFVDPGNNCSHPFSHYSCFCLE
ncbi:MAG: hypothetical protein HYV07_07170 [Deltaproteobacteria bacterium]|nr:hypothetical protein [Deltaproteobacteria bacterium]